jgi:hypothetical protein
MHAPRPLYLLLATLLALVGTSSAFAQDSPRAVTGRVSGADGAPLAGVTVRLTRDDETRITRTDNAGRFRYTGLADGRWTLTAMRIGFTPVSDVIDLTIDGVYREIVLQERPAQLDSVLVSARWTGVRGVVYDARQLAPLADARVHLLGTDSIVRTDASGTFALEMSRGRTVVVRVERDGFLPALRSADVGTGSYVEFDVPMDTANPAPKDYIDMKDLQLRLKMSGTRSVVVSGDDLRRSGALSAKEAYNESQSGLRSGVRIMRTTCVFVNGRARPGFPFDALRASDIELVEAYAPGSELSRTLYLRWPRGATCGAPGPTEPRYDPRWRAEYVSVWLRGG